MNERDPLGPPDIVYVTEWPKVYGYGVRNMPMNADFMGYPTIRDIRRYDYSRMQLRVLLTRRCPQCGSEEGSGTDWRYVDGHYEHRCPQDSYLLGHYVSDYNHWIAQICEIASTYRPGGVTYWLTEIDNYGQSDGNTEAQGT